MKLVKLFLMSAIFLGTVTVAKAQDKSSNKDSMLPSFGIKGGVNFASVTGGEDFKSPDSRTSFHVGALVEIPVADILSIQVEGLYSAQGFKSDFRDTDGDKIEGKLDYINVPVLAKIYIVKGLSLEVGPQFSFLLNDKIDSPFSDDEIELADLGLKTEKFEFGVAAGITFLTDIGLFATGRYNYGVTEIFKDSKLKNSVFQLGVGYKF